MLAQAVLKLGLPVVRLQMLPPAWASISSSFPESFC